MKLHMIGNSHIDPVWFWRREEGMQEVRATFSSALDRMDEYPDFRYTCTSAAFFAFLAEAQPELLGRIRKRVDEGRFEVTGGWWVEPDCCLPCGEAFVRQGLYGQRTLKKLLGRYAWIGSNVDSFGHSPMLPQILRGCGLTAYVFMRPSLTRSPRKYMDSPVPLVNWISPDGSEVAALSLPAEYTCWFEESTRQNIQDTLAAPGDFASLPCFFGVGNHGGGPTKANIEAIGHLRSEFPDAQICFSTLDAFFREAADWDKPQLTSSLEFINVGCYGVDQVYKQRVRAAEQALLRAERLSVWAETEGLGQSKAAEMEKLWERLLFCQFHDTLGGTAIREARDDALGDVSGVLAQAEQLGALAVQRISAAVDTRGEGHPILLMNDTAAPFDGVIDMELNWFCLDPLTLLDERGCEIPYQREKQSCTMRWYHLGGRRRVLFRAQIPAFGQTLLRAFAVEPARDPEPGHDASDGLTLDNGLVRLTMDEKGRLLSLTDLEENYEALGGAAEPWLWLDERDTWGGGEGCRYEAVRAVDGAAAVRVTSGSVRSTIRVTCRDTSGDVRGEWDVSLDAGERFARVEARINWDAPWKQLKLHLPLPQGFARTVAEGPYCELTRPADERECYMHRFVDAQDAAGRGLLVVNDGVYSFSAASELRLTLLRSAIFAQGSCAGWQNDYDKFEYHDLGEHRYRFLLRPHGTPLRASERLALADRLSCPPVALADCFHAGAHGPRSFAQISEDSVRLGAMKQGEEGGVALRLYETAGAAAETTVRLGETQVRVRLRPYEIKTLLVRDGKAAQADMLERIQDEESDDGR